MDLNATNKPADYIEDEYGRSICMHPKVGHGDLVCHDDYVCAHFKVVARHSKPPIPPKNVDLFDLFEV